MKRRKGEWVCPNCGERLPDDLKQLEPKRERKVVSKIDKKIW